jgi:toxin secretion/phage lysis holin
MQMKDTLMTTLTTIGTAITTTLLGGWDRALEILLIFIALDYLTGIGAAMKTKTLKSSIGFEGLMKKATIFLMVILAAQLDRITGNTAGVFRTATAFFFISNEGLSILENVGQMGVKLPAFIAGALTKLQDENDVKGSDDDSDSK